MDQEPIPCVDSLNNNEKSNISLKPWMGVLPNKQASISIFTRTNHSLCGWDLENLGALPSLVCSIGNLEISLEGEEINTKFSFLCLAANLAAFPGGSQGLGWIWASWVDASLTWTQAAKGWKEPRVTHSSKEENLGSRRKSPRQVNIFLELLQVKTFLQLKKESKKKKKKQGGWGKGKQ